MKQDCSSRLHRDSRTCLWVLNTEIPIKAKGKKSVEEVYKNGLFTINGIDKDNNLYPITHKGDPERIGQPMTDEELHVFGVELVLVYYHYQKLKSHKTIR